MIRLGWYFDTAARLQETSRVEFLARVLGHLAENKACLARVQGRCPGLEYCHDCPWGEGMTREPA